VKNLIFFITLAIVIFSVLTSYQTLPLAAAIHSNLPGSPEPQSFHQKGDLANNYPDPPGVSGPSCVSPRPDEVRICHELEQQILASTVRLVWHRSIRNDNGSGYTFVDESIALATIKEGRYLVTHNHSSILLSDRKKGESIIGFVYSTNGELIWEMPLDAVTIMVTDPETLVLDFGSYGGQGLFDAMGISSAEFKTWESLPLQAGMEVAQIGWDGATAHVDWVTINQVRTEHGTPRLELANVVAPGASGGGVFWNGYHIANTWSQVTTSDENSGVVLRQYSVAALNSPLVTAHLQ
jgi:hypothetical protein